MADANTINTVLKDTSQITGAAWAVCVAKNQSGWDIQGSYRLTKVREKWIQTYLSDAKVDRWIFGAMAGGSSRSRKIDSVPEAGVRKVDIFPITTSQQVLLVGSNSLESNDKKLWRLIAGSAFSNEREASLTHTDAFVFGGQTSVPYDLPRSLDRILGRIMQYVPADGGWLAIYGERSLKIEAQRKAAKLQGREFLPGDSSILVQVQENREPLRIEKGDPLWSQVIIETTAFQAKSWVALPLTIGYRLIGIIAFWRDETFSDEEWLNLQHLSRYAAAAAEMFITFAEMADHLKRQAMLNDFALVISSAQNLDQIVQRVFALLTRTFNTAYISLFLLSSDGRTLREYRNLEQRLTPRTEFLDGHPIADFVYRGTNLRIEDAQAEKYPFINSGAEAALIIPLKYRGDVIGVLSLESEENGAFSGYDENLLVVIASHLAGLVEYGRLRDEAEARARNLGLIHEVIQQVIGLTNIEEVAQLTANILVQYFSYELAVILLVDRNNELKINGISGVAAPHIKAVLETFENPATGGITGYVYKTGNSIMVDDVTKHQEYLPVPEWDAGSEICVALREGERVLGVIDVESSTKNAFNHNDLLALESLAGFLTSAVSSVDRYQMLQDTIQILQTTQEELNERMEAQRNAENRLIQAAKLAAVGEMAAGVAHELNNPLTTVAGFSELVLDDLPADAPQRADLELVLREATRARNVVRRLLDFARQSESVRVRADLNEVIEDVEALTRHLFETNKIDFSMNLRKDLPWVLMDRDQIKQVVLNLLHNALHAMPDGGSLTVTTRTHHKGGRNWIVMDVQDTGKGITPHDLARIFEPFFTTKADEGGTGLGLAVSYGIITDHGGLIDVNSAPNQGARFSVWLPIEENHS